MTNDRRVLLLGAGLVTPPLVNYLLDRDVVLTIAANNPHRAKEILDDHPDGHVVEWQADDVATLAGLIDGADVVISLLPATMHARIAELCVETNRHMVTASYVSPEMMALNDKARASNVILLNELGVDPGLDHMSAMRVIDDIKKRGGHVTSFHSYCGGLPAPDANDNPWSYKFSWNPLGVLRATSSSARYLELGSERVIPPELLFVETHPLRVAGMEFEAYANRDSLRYIKMYGLDGIETMYRGTLRWPGWAATMRALRLLGLLSEAAPVGDTWTATLAAASGLPPHLHLLLRDMDRLFRKAVDAHGDRLLTNEEAGEVIERLDWLGLLGETPPSGDKLGHALAAEMEKRMSYKPGERDMLVMQHRFVAELPQPQGTKQIHSTMVAYGEPGGDSAMARTVGLPVAIATRMILDGEVTEPGVRIPVRRGLYEPILEELEELGIHLEEELIMEDRHR